nr:adenine nucleotide alpha hydrolase family protein [Anaerolineae bacterium]
MKCRKCKDKAVINMRHHKLALCKDHYLAWVLEQTERFICKYHMFTVNEKVLIAVSGGKDSLALWDVLLSLGYQVDGIYINLGIDAGIGYSERSLSMIRKFMETHGEAVLKVVDVPVTYGASITTAASRTHRGKGRPCSVCGLTKRHIMNRIAEEGGYDVLVTGHNLDDEAAVLLGNTLTWQTGYLARQAPVLPASGAGLVRKAKPFCRFYERETAAYALLAGIDYVYDECPHAVGAKSIYYKELLNTLEEERPGAKLQFYLNFLRARDEGAFRVFEEQVELNKCSQCGQPTSLVGLCTFCRTWQQVNSQSGNTQ